MNRNLDTTTVHRGYSWLDVRAVDDDKRIIEGVATTPMQARDGDILETAGIQFKLPVPFLYRHFDPFGNVIDAKVNADGIRVRIQVAAAGVSESIDEYWRLIKSGTVRGLSIGWRTLQELYDKEIGGYRILKSEWLELSAVPVPADPNATITSVRSADEAILAALGRRSSSSSAGQNNRQPGASGLPKGRSMKTFKTQIEESERQRTTLAARMTAIMEIAPNGELDEESGREYDGLTEEIAAIDVKLKRLRAHETNIAAPVRITSEVGADPAAGSGARATVVTDVKDNIPKGNRMARMVIALVRAGGNHMYAAELAKANFKDTPEVAHVLRAAVDAGDTTTSGWAAQLIPAAQQMQNEFLELLRPATIIGRIPGLRRVPFNVAVPLQSGGGTYGWVGEAKAKPVTSATFGNATLRWAKAAGIIVITKELARFSSPSAEAIIRDEMIQGCTRFLDVQFIDENVAEEANVHPASITRDIGPETPSGTTAEAFRYDISVLMGSFITDNQDPSNAVLLMSATTAMGLSLMTNALGQPEFPTISMKGGTILGLPVIVSENVGARVILVNASDILLADDGSITVDMSDQASVEMSSTPLAGEESPIDSTIFKSLWQNNLIGLRVERFITWKRARISAVAWLDNVAYAPTQPGSPE